MKPDLWAIIPVKPFTLGKSRLAAVLDDQARATLSRRLFNHVFATAIAVLGAGRVAVVTSDAGLSAAIEARGAYGVIDPGELNAALGRACRFAMERGAPAIMVLPSDLPFLSEDDITALVSALAPAPSVVIAPDAAEQATNALVLSPPDSDFFRFGPSSFAAHAAAAHAGNATIEIVRRLGLAFDLDTPEDYREFLKRTGAPAA
jgi:2-phospho-L-lactate guanylyltransferase